jgi:hypothetical protein
MKALQSKVMKKILKDSRNREELTRIHQNEKDNKPQSVSFYVDGEKKNYTLSSIMR